MSQVAELLAATAAADDHSLEHPPAIGPYRVLGLLGTGGMGRVYRCHDPVLKRTVAIKLLSPRMAEIPVCLERFEREACVIATLVHPNVVQAYSIGRGADGLYLAMEFVEGTCAERMILRGGGLHPADTMRLVAATAAGLAAAHKIGVIHCDVKPSNILVARGGGVKIVDFGLAEPVAAEGKLLDAGLTAGSPAYISPEAACGRPTDHRSDMYSLGITMYEMLTGERPFSAAHVGDLLRKHVREPLPDLRPVLPNLPESVIAVAHRLTAKSPDARYATWSEANAAIAGAIASMRVARKP